MNCAAIPEELFESEFFGHVRGAYTGAVRDRAGRFELADGGTLFLDEVGEIPAGPQGKLLRVLQEGTFERIGEERTRLVNVRVIAATNRDLSEESKPGASAKTSSSGSACSRWRCRPCGTGPKTSRSPAISSRWRPASSAMPAPTLKERHRRQLAAHDWPGNVRELQNAVERALILGRGKDLVFDLPDTPGAPVTVPGPSVAWQPTGPAEVLSEAEMMELQKRNIVAALEKTEWRIQGEGGAAELLGIKPTTLRSRMQALGIGKPG